MFSKNISLTSLITSLLFPIQSKEYTPLPGENVYQTTLRLEPEIKAFYEDVANQLNISLQAAISMTLKGVMTNSQSISKTNLELMYDRFFDLFSQHEIPISDIPEFLADFKINRSALAHKDRLLDLLDHNVLDFLSKTFFVKTSWLKGMEGRATCSSKIHWYKNTISFCSYLNELSQKDEKFRVLFISNRNVDKLHEARTKQLSFAQVGIVIAYHKRTSLDQPYTVYEIFEHGPWYYEKSRMDLKVIMMFCLKNGFDFHGKIMDNSRFEALFGHQIYGSYIFHQAATWTDPLDYVTASNLGNKDMDELPNVIDHYCQFDRITEYCDGKNKQDNGSFRGFRPNFEQYKYGEKQPLKTFYKDVIEDRSSE